MSIFNIFKGKSTLEGNKQNIQYVEMMNGNIPIFSQFGEDIYISDIIQGCIRCIATAMGKLQPKHIRTDSNGIQLEVIGNINRLLKFKPNTTMTTTDFLEKITYLREVKKNVFIYPAYKEIFINDKYIKREYTGLYPLNPVNIEFLEDVTGSLFVKFYFPNGKSYMLPYRDVIHWKKDFGANEFMGGDSSGQADNRALLRLLDTDNIILQGMEKTVKATLGIKGIIKINSMLNDDKQRAERIAFENKLKNNESGFLTLDMKSEFIPLTVDPKLIDHETMEFVVQRILNNYGVPLAVYNGDFSEEQYQAFYEKTLEPMVISLGRCFSSTIFTERELDIGNEIIFYNQGLMFTNMANKIKAVDILSSRGTLTDNQILAIFGYPPFEGGDIRKQSLNYINRDLADTYQIDSKSKEGEKNK